MGFILGDGELLPSMGPSILPQSISDLAQSAMVDELLNEPVVLEGGQAEGGLQEEETAEVMKPAKRARVPRETEDTERRWRILNGWFH